MYYLSCFLVVISSSSYCRMKNKMSHNMGGYEKGGVGVVVWCALLVAILM